MHEEAGAWCTPVWASLSSRGGRSENQDRCGDAVAPDGHVFVVADGLGGHAGGALAAEAGVAASLEALRKTCGLAPERLRSAFDAAQHAVQAVPRRNPAASGCRTTAVMLVIAADRALWGHLGDTRLYHLRGGRVVHQTLDHSLPQMLVQTGSIRPEEIRGHPDRNRLLKSLGGEGEAEATLLDAPVALEAGDVFLLCSDGFWELVPEAEMEATLARARDPRAWLQEMERQLLGQAHGAFDNYSATAVFVGGKGGEGEAGGKAAGRSRPGSGLLIRVLAILGLLLAGFYACIRAHSEIHPLILSGLSAPGLFASGPAPREVPHGSPSHLRLHSPSTDPRGRGGP